MTMECHSVGGVQKVGDGDQLRIKRCYRLSDLTFMPRDQGQPDSKKVVTISFLILRKLKTSVFADNTIAYHAYNCLRHRHECIAREYAVRTYARIIIIRTRKL